MNTQSSALPESFGSQATAPLAIPATRRMYWSVRRELWENRFIYVAPLGVAAVFLLVFSLTLVRLPHKLRALSDAAQRHHALSLPYELSAGLIMGTALLVGLYYAVDALYSERRDRSILFWKSLPVSDLTAVLSKLAIPLVIVPLLSFVITVVTQFIMLVLSSLVLMGSGLSISELWSQSSFLQVSLIVLYHIVLVHGLWYAPIYGWLLLVSAWAPRAPLVWAVLPPFVICGVEKIAFNTTHFLRMLELRFAGPPPHAATASGNARMDMAAQLIPAHFFSEPGLWIGIAIAAIFLAGAVRLRRYHGPI